MLKELYLLWLRLAAPQDLHYINGADTLPPPLPPEQERAALDALTRGQPQARDLLITHNLRLVVYIAKKFETPTAGIEDMISIGTIGLIKAVNTFEPTKNIKLATYASRCIENEILMYLRKSSNRRQDASIDEPLNTDTDGNELLLMDVLTSDDPQVGEELERSAERAALRGAVGRLSPRERRIMELRFGLNHETEHTQKEVCSPVGAGYARPAACPSAGAPGKPRAAQVRPLQGNAFYTTASARVFVTNSTASPAIMFISGCKEYSRYSYPSRVHDIPVMRPAFWRWVTVTPSMSYCCTSSNAKSKKPTG